MTPYADYVKGKDPLDVLRSTLDGYREVFVRNGAAEWAKPWAPASAFEAVRRMNINLVGALTTAQRAAKITHPERGVIDIEDLIVTLAGHGAHHLAQFRPN